jgi:hypothetical protein
LRESKQLIDFYINSIEINNYLYLKAYLFEIVKTIDGLLYYGYRNTPIAIPPTIFSGVVKTINRVL